MSTDLPANDAPPLVTPRRRPRRAWRGLVVENLAVVVVFGAVGTGAGWLWFRLWDPPLGAVQDGRWLYDDYAAIREVFSATGLYVVIGVLAGLGLGVAAALVCRRSELVTMAAVALGSALAAYACYRVGLSMSPPDPQTLAAGLPQGTELPGELTMPGTSPYVAWPLGALTGLAFTYFLTSGVSTGVEQARRLDDDAGWATPHA